MRESLDVVLVRVVAWVVCDSARAQRDLDPGEKCLPGRRRRAWWGRRAVPVGWVTLAIGVGATPAHAVLVKTATGAEISYQATVHRAGVLAAAARGRAPRALGSVNSDGSCSGAPCLAYGGGPVMRTTRLTPVYWDPTGGAAYPGGYQSQLEEFLSDVATDSGTTGNFFSTLPQYYESIDVPQNHVQYTVTAAPALLDTAPYPTNTSSGDACVTPFPVSPSFPVSRPCITDQGVRTELSSFLDGRGAAGGVGHEYVVFFPPGTDSCIDPGGPGGACSGTSYCAYHSQLTLPHTGEIEYANEPDNGDPRYGGICTPGGSGSSPAQDTINTTSHEVSESVIDPQPTNGWYDTASQMESGDLCAWSFKQGDPPLQQLQDVPASGSNQTINGHSYLTQVEWDNANNTCSISDPSAHITAPATAPSGTPVRFDGSQSEGSSGSTVGEYQWNWGDGATDSTAQPTISHSFATPGAYTVKLTVTDGSGLHGTTTEAQTIVTLQNPTAGPSVTTSAPTAGQPVSFSGAGSTDPNPGGSISSYRWTFGDGGSVGGASPTHTFASSGSYTATLTVTDNYGAVSDTSSMTVVVVAAPPPPAPPPPTLLVVTPTSPPAIVFTPPPGPVSTPVATAPQSGVKAFHTTLAATPTRSQRLARAIAACTRLKRHNQRAKCVAAAKKRFAPPKRRPTKHAKSHR